MSLSRTTADAVIRAAITIGVGVLVAIIAHLVFARVAKLAARTSALWDDALVKAARRIVQAAAILAAIEIAARGFPLTNSAKLIVSHTDIALLFVVVTLEFARLSGFGVNAYAAKRTSMGESASLFVNITKVLVFILGGLIVLQTFGVSITPLLTALGVGGLAVALALQDTLANLFAGVHILASRKIEPGDYVKLASGEEGYVVDVNWRNTAIRALANNLILVPNSVLASQVVTNYHRPVQEMSVLLQVGVAYDSDLEHVEAVSIEVAKGVLQDIQGAVPDAQPAVRYHTFGNSSIDFSLILRAQEYVDQYLITHECIKRLHKRYNEEGIEIPFPITTVIMGKDSDTESTPS